MAVLPPHNYMKLFNVLITTTLVLILCFPGDLIAQQQLGHVVSLEELRTALVSRSAQRTADASSSSNSSRRPSEARISRIESSLIPTNVAHGSST